MAIRLEPKRADEERTYRHDWSAFLGGDTLASQTTTSSDVTVESSSIEAGDQSVRFKLSGGDNGTTAIITQHIVTANGEEETELFTLALQADDVVSLAEVKTYLGVFSNDKDASIAGMIPRARQWVEDHTGLVLVPRQFEERLLPTINGIVRLSKGPLITVDAVDYLDSAGAAATFTPTAYAPSTELLGDWPGLATNEAFAVTYTAGLASGEVDERLTGAVLALIEGEFSEGYAYPERSTDAAARCCAYLRKMVA